MMTLKLKKELSLLTLATLAVSTVGSAAARADGFSCRDYYSAYVMQATEPTPTVIVDCRPNYHGHYPEYHDGGGYGHDGGGEYHGGGNGGSSKDSAAAAIAIVAILAALSTTTAIQDAELQDAENVMSDIDEAQLGDGAQLRQLQAKVQADLPSGKTASLAQVAAAVAAGNQQLAFCAGGNLESESELASTIAASL